jgi:hypothetical protein
MIQVYFLKKILMRHVRTKICVPPTINPVIKGLKNLFSTNF